MIAKVGILLALLSSDGYWFGGSAEKVAFQWAVLRGPPDARIEWELASGRLVVAKGQFDFNGAPPSEPASIEVPEVRVPAEMTLRYRAVDREGKRVIEEGQAIVHVYPRNLFDSAAKRLRGQELYVWDEPTGLSAILKEAKIVHTSFQDPQKLQFVRPDILIVGAQQLALHPEGQSKLINLAVAGAGVLILRQTGMPRVAGYPLAPRTAPAKLAMLDEHRLLRHLRQWSLPSADPAWAIVVPVDEALPIMWWPGDYPAQHCAEVDALVATKTLGRGRIVFCQYPLGPWKTDPRSQLFLDDALDYLRSPVASTARVATDQ